VNRSGIVRDLFIHITRTRKSFVTHSKDEKSVTRSDIVRDLFIHITRTRRATGRAQDVYLNGHVKVRDSFK